MIQATDREESKFCRAAAGLGWDPYALDDEQRDGILLLAEKLGVLLDEAVPALDTENLYAGWSAIVSAVEQAKLNSVSLRFLAPLCDEVVQNERTRGNPWEVGYGLARRLRGSLNAHGDPLPTMTQLADVLGEDPELIEKVTQPASPFAEAPLIDGVITRNDDQLPALPFAGLANTEDDSTSAVPWSRCWRPRAKMPSSPERIPSGNSATVPSQPSSWPPRQA